MTAFLPIQANQIVFLLACRLYDNWVDYYSESPKALLWDRIVHNELNKLDFFFWNKGPYLLIYFDHYKTETQTHIALNIK